MAKKKPAAAAKKAAPPKPKKKAAGPAPKAGGKAPALKKGDEVTWSTSQGETEGKVVKKLTSPIEIKGHHVAASPDNPEILVESAKTGAQAAHKPGSLKKKAPKKKPDS